MIVKRMNVCEPVGIRDNMLVVGSGFESLD